MIEALARADADIAAGRTHDLEEFLCELDAEDAADAAAAAHSPKGTRS